MLLLLLLLLLGCMLLLSFVQEQEDGSGGGGCCRGGRQGNDDQEGQRVVAATAAASSWRRHHFLPVCDLMCVRVERVAVRVIELSEKAWRKKDLGKGAHQLWQSGGGLMTTLFNLGKRSLPKASFQKLPGALQHVLQNVSPLSSRSLLQEFCCGSIIHI